MSSDDGTPAPTGSFDADGSSAGASSPASSPSPRNSDGSARPATTLASDESTCDSEAGASVVCFSATTSAPDAGRSVSTATGDADVVSVAVSVADSLLVKDRSEADKSGSAAFAAGVATDAAAATRLDFRLKKHTRVTLRSRASSSVSKRRPRGDQIPPSTRNAPRAPGSISSGLSSSPIRASPPQVRPREAPTGFT